MKCCLGIAITIVFLTAGEWAVAAEDQAHIDQLLSMAQEPSEELTKDINEEITTAIEKMAAQPEAILPESIKNSKPMVRAAAKIKGTTEGSTIDGDIELVETAEGLMVLVNLNNVPPGKHGFHIHENGSCEEQGKAAGGHFNPAQVDHGFLPHDGHTGAHAGDMGNVDVKENGKAVLSLILPQVNLTKGEYNVMGKSVILHEKEDDFGQLTGNAGGRIGCGIIEQYKE